MKSLLIAGCGDLGTRLADRLDSADWRIAGLRRDVGQLPRSIQGVAGRF